jgi:hypothetical protein
MSVAPIQAPAPRSPNRRATKRHNDDGGLPYWNDATVCCTPMQQSVRPQLGMSGKQIRGRKRTQTVHLRGGWLPDRRSRAAPIGRIQRARAWAPLTLGDAGGNLRQPVMAAGVR